MLHNFLISQYDYLPFYVEGLTFLVSLYYLPFYKKTFLRFFPVFLFIVFMVEITGRFILYPNYSPQWLYNFLNLLNFLFFYGVFYHYVSKANYLKLILYSVGIFMVSVLVNSLYKNFFKEAQLLSYIVGACLLIFCIILYYIEILNSPKILNVTRELLFWISVGLLLFYVGYIPIKVTRTFFISEYNVYPTLQRVHFALVIIMNVCFIIGLKWTKKNSRL